LVTTSEFTPAAQASARETGIELISGERIAACYREAEPELRRQAELRLQRDEQWRQEKRLRAKAEAAAKAKRAADLQEVARLRETVRLRAAWRRLEEAKESNRQALNAECRRDWDFKLTLIWAFCLLPLATLIAMLPGVARYD